jgi:hypothetical protein
MEDPKFLIMGFRFFLSTIGCARDVVVDEVKILFFHMVAPLMGPLRDGGMVLLPFNLV